MIAPPPDISTNKRNILLTGRPGIGKTTVIVRLVYAMRRRSVAGFYTAEMRTGAHREGFRAHTLAGPTAVLASTKIKSRQRVGRYGVDVPAFEQVVLPELARRADVVFIDEIGRMECFSDRFVRAVQELLDGPTPVVATIAAKGGGFIAAVKARGDVETLQVTTENREELPRQLAGLLLQGGAP